MDNTMVEALRGFSTTVTGSIGFADVLTVMGIAVGAGAVLFLASWGGKKIVRAFKNGLNGRLKV